MVRGEDVMEEKEERGEKNFWILGFWDIGSV